MFQAFLKYFISSATYISHIYYISHISAIVLNISDNLATDDPDPWPPMVLFELLAPDGSNIWLNFLSQMDLI